MLLLTFILLSFSFFYLKKAVLFTSAVLLFLPHWLSGIGSIKLLYLVCIVQVLLYYIKGFHKKRSEEYPRFLLWPSVIMFVGWILSNLVSNNYEGLKVTVVQSFAFLYFPFIFWKFLRTESDIKYHLKTMSVFFFLSGLYTVLEAIFHYNYLSEFMTNYGLSESYIVDYSSGERFFGLPKCYSFFPFCSSLGMASAYFFYIAYYCKMINIKLRFHVILLVLMLFSVLLCSTRSQYIVFSLLLVSLIFCGRVKSKWRFYLIISIFIVIVVFSSQFLFLIDTIFNSNSYEGSTSDMRMTQLEISLKYTENSLLFGNGRNFTWYVTENEPELFGAESEWFKQIMDYGILGCSTYMTLILADFLWLRKFSKMISFVPIAYMVGKTLSSVIGIELNFLLIESILFVRLVTTFENKNSKECRYEK